MKNKKLFWILLISILIIIFPMVDKTFQNDTFFTIPTGNYILENGIDDVEPFTFHENLKFTKLRWAFDITVASVYNIAGFSGIYILTVIIAGLIAATLFTTMVKQETSKFLAFIITIFTMVTLSGGLVCRAQIISYLLFALEMYSIQQLMLTNKKKYSVYLILINIGILSFHSSVWLTYFVFFVPYIIEYAISKLKINSFFEKSEKIVIQDTKIKLLIITLLISLICGFISPLGISNFTYMPKVIGGTSSEIIFELQPLMIEENTSLVIVTLILFIITAFTKAKIRITDLMYIVGFLIMATLAERNVFIAIVAITLPIANLINSAINSYDKQDVFEFIDNKFEKWTSIIIVLLFSFYITLINYKSNINAQYVDETKYPIQAAEYIKSNIDMENMRLYNHFNFGSYLELQGIPTFMDSRSEIYCEEFNDVTILNDFRDLEISGTTNISTIVNKYDITHVICYANSNVVTYMNNSANYKEIYKDSYFTIYEVIK